jgi:hypothetical protein
MAPGWNSAIGAIYLLVSFRREFPLIMSGSRILPAGRGPHAPQRTFTSQDMCRAHARWILLFPSPHQRQAMAPWRDCHYPGPEAERYATLDTSRVEVGDDRGSDA